MAGNELTGGPHARRRALLTERDWRIYHERVKGKTLTEIGALFPNPKTGKPMSAARVSQICAAAIGERRGDMAEGLAEWRQEQRVAAMVKLDVAEAEVWRVIERKHLLVSSGRVVLLPALDAAGQLVPLIDADTGQQRLDENGDPMYVMREPVLDDGPVLTAINGALDKIWRRRAALLGLDEPAQAEVRVATYNYTVNGVDPGDLS